MWNPSAGSHPRWSCCCNLWWMPLGACLPASTSSMWWFSWRAGCWTKGRWEMALFLQRSGRRSLLSMQQAAQWQRRALGSTRAVFRNLKEITVVPGALFLPASAAGKASEWMGRVCPTGLRTTLYMAPSPQHPSYSLSTWQTELTELDLGILNLADAAKWFLLFLIRIHTKFLQFYFPLPSSLKGEAIAFLEVAYDFSRQKLFPFQGYWQYPNICPGIGQSQGAWFRAAASNV